MNFSSPFKGQILILSAKDKKSLKYDVTPSKPEFKDLLMCNFDQLKLSTTEKRNLSNKHRELIHRYSQIDQTDIDEFSKKLAITLTNLHRKNKKRVLRIKAEGFGAFICLRSIMAYDLPEKAHFELVSIPLKLFPKKLITKPKATLPVKFVVETDSWLNSLETLYWDDDVVESLDTDEESICLENQYAA